jgi:cysteinyl-tRNA synthetase
MAKSSGGFLRVQTLMDKGYDPLAYRFFCLSAHYRAKLNFTWESLDGAATALNRLRLAAYEWGAPDTLDEGYMDRLAEHVNDDLNMPRAAALTWDLAKSDLPAATKKATLLEFDKMLGLRLADRQPTEEIVPEEITTLVQQRQQARQEKRWKDADTVRDQIAAAGYEIKDTPQGPRVKRRVKTEG